MKKYKTTNMTTENASLYAILAVLVHYVLKILAYIKTNPEVKPSLLATFLGRIVEVIEGSFAAIENMFTERARRDDFSPWNKVERARWRICLEIINLGAECWARHRAKSLWVNFLSLFW